MLASLILGFSGITLLLLGITIAYSNFRLSSNRWLGAFSLSGCLWIAANLLANLTEHHYGQYLLFSRLTLIGAALTPLCFLMFCVNFTNRKITHRWYYAAIFVPVLVLLATTPTKLNLVNVSTKDFSVQPGPAYALLLVIFVTYFSSGVWLLVSDYRQASAVRRQQLYYILLGTALTVVPGILMNAVLPLFGYSALVSIGPATAVFLTLFTTIAIVKHRLFDIKLVIARSLTYATLVLVLATIYGFFVLGVARFAFGLHLRVGAQILLSLATAAMVIAFQRLRATFDRLTSRLFYQDSYDAQELFDNLNRLLVSTLDIRQLMQASSDIIAKALRPRQCLIGLRDDAQGYRLFGQGAELFKIEPQEVAYLRALTVQRRERVIVTDYLDPVKDERLRQILQKYDISVLIRLAHDVRRREEGLGYLVLGPKKSGNAYTKQDFRTLEAVANDLILAIQNALHFEEIQNFNATLQERIAEATRKLRRTNEKLKALDEAKDDFVSMASHQLRTPLTSIKGYTSMVLEGDAGRINATQRRLLEQSFFSSQRMVYLIADLLNVSRLKTGKFIIEPVPVNLADVVEQEIGQLKETAAGRSLELVYDKPDSFPALMLDETKTRQVIMNFVDNAIYYTPAGGHIAVKLVETPASIELRVVDDGIGVPKTEQPHLFTKFYRAGNARKARPDGTGLGLFMAKKVVVAEGGAILFNTEEGKGSTFGFVFSKSLLAPGEYGPLPTETAPATASIKH